MPMGWYNLHFSNLPEVAALVPPSVRFGRATDFPAPTSFKVGEGLDDGPIVASPDHQADRP